MKTYQEQEYKCEVPVLVTYYKNDGSIDLQWEDGIKGLNVGHALYNARLNWIGASIKALN